MKDKAIKALSKKTSFDFVKSRNPSINLENPSHFLNSGYKTIIETNSNSKIKSKINHSDGDYIKQAKENNASISNVDKIRVSVPVLVDSLNPSSANTNILKSKINQQLSKRQITNLRNISKLGSFDFLGKVMKDEKDRIKSSVLEFQKCNTSRKHSVSNLLKSPPIALDHDKLHDLNFLGVLGEGANCKVRLVQNTKTKLKYAMKTFDRLSSTTAGKTNIDNEVELLRKMNHPHIVKLHDSFASSRHVYLMLEYSGTKSLRHLLDKQADDRIDERCCRSVFGRVAEAMGYLHRLRIYHRDLKLENILCGSTFDNVKLIDFGFAVKMVRSGLSQVVCGTPCYLAPEIIDGNPYLPEKTDIWAFGICIYRALFGKFPFVGVSQLNLYQKIKEGKLKLPWRLSNSAENLIESCLRIYPKDRPNFSSIIIHDFFS